MMDRAVILLPQPDSPTIPKVSPGPREKAHPVHRFDHAGPCVEVSPQVPHFQYRGFLQRIRPNLRLAPAQFGVEGVPQPISEEVKRQDHRRDG